MCVITLLIEPIWLSPKAKNFMLYFRQLQEYKYYGGITINL